MREREKTHSVWYKPSAPRVNYSLLVMESVEMMKMATGDGSLLRQGVGIGARLIFGGYSGLWRRDSRSRFCSGSLEIYRRGWRRFHIRGPHKESTRQGARPPPSWGPRDSSPVAFCSSIFYIFQKISVDFQRIPRTSISAQKQHHGSSAENSVSPG